MLPTIVAILLCAAFAVFVYLKWNESVESDGPVYPGKPKDEFPRKHIDK